MFVKTLPTATIVIIFFFVGANSEYIHNAIKQIFISNTLCGTFAPPREYLANDSFYASHLVQSTPELPEPLDNLIFILSF